ncbi:MAG: response regulator transcription factor [Candidatus Accumulibacter sp. UW20]|jgi:DNA-binding response OmpR family regulator
MRLLAIEDNRDILANVADYLEAKGYTVDCAGNGPHGLHLALTHAYDLMILDLMLPGIDGYQLCQRLREAGSEVPIIMLTARDTLEDRLQGLKAGADDYLVKPFALAELAARIEAVLRRSQGGRKRLLQVADLVFDLDGLQIRRAGQTLRLNPTGQKILELLMRRSPAVVRRELIEEALWGELPPPSDSLRSHIHLLRQAIDKPFARPLLQTIHSVGYRLSDESDGA